MKYLFSVLVAVVCLACTPGKTKIVSMSNPEPSLHDIWALEAIKGKDVDFTNQALSLKHPTLEINLTTLRVLGNDGCNDFTGELRTITEKKVRIGRLYSTLMACPDEKTIPRRVNAALRKVHSYELKGLKLHLFNSLGREVLRYRKVD